MQEKHAVNAVYENTPEMPDDVLKIAEIGATVEFYPKAFKEKDNCPCGECYTVYMAGWYKILPHNSRFILCDVDGNPATGKDGNKFGIIDSEEGVYNT